MWFERSMWSFLQSAVAIAHPVKVLKGPRQVGKTSLLQRLPGYEFVSLDDIHQRTLAQENPIFFLDQLPQKILLDEATLAPALFPELKRRADIFKAAKLARKKEHSLFDVWITGSNQTLLQKSVRESLAGRASYFDLNTLS
ncbi:MAG: AAA family ATPase, partial [Spirochaetes bacterium]|nr:AAA family ATPase [Spirochaetota bacterium]